MSNFLGNLAARSLGRVEVLRPLPRIYAAPVADVVPVFVRPTGEKGSDTPTPENPLVSANPSEAEADFTPAGEPPHGLDPAAVIVLGSGPQPATLMTPPWTDAGEINAPPSLTSIPPSPRADRAMLPTESTSPTTASPTTEPRSRPAPVAAPVSRPIPATRVELTQGIRTETSRASSEPPVLADTIEVVSRTEQGERPAQEQSLQFLVPEQRQRSEAGETVPASSGRQPLLLAAAPIPHTEVPHSPLVSVTIGRLEVRVNTPPTRPAAASKTTPAVMSLEEYLRSRGRGGEE